MEEETVKVNDYIVKKLCAVCARPIESLGNSYGFTQVLFDGLSVSGVAFRVKKVERIVHEVCGVPAEVESALGDMFKRQDMFEFIEPGVGLVYGKPFKTEEDLT